MKLIVDIALEHDLFIIADEVYREFVYDGKEMSSFGSFKEAEQNVIIVDSVSKRFSACGARIGSIACKNEELMMNIMKLAQARLCCPTIDQVGAAALYNLDPSYFDDIKKEYEILHNELVKYNPELLDKRRVLAITKSDMLDEELIEALSQDLPEGIPYVFISSITGLGIVELKDLLWKELNKENFHEAERIVHKNIDVSTLEFEDDDEYIFPVDEDEDDPDEEYEEYWDDDEDEDTRK